MKILVVSNYRGLHTCRPEAEIFIGLKRMGFVITIITYPDAEYIQRFRDQGITVHTNHPTKRYDPVFIEELRVELAQGRYDIVQLYNNKAISNGIRSARNVDVKVVIYRGASSNMSWLNPINYLKFFHPRVDYVICNSEEIRNKFLAVPFYKKEKAVTILKGHDTKWYSDVEKHDIRKELNISEGELVLVNVANNRKFKAIPDLIKAMKYIPSQMKIALLIIGRKMDNAELLRLTKASGNQEKIHFLGYRKDSINIVASSDVFVLPSIGGESLTKSVVEAMSLGIVPLISDIDGNKPLVDDGVNGVIFKKANPKNLAQKIIYLEKNRNILPRLSEEAKKKIDSDIHTDNTVEQYASFYRSILDETN